MGGGLGARSLYRMRKIMKYLFIIVISWIMFSCEGKIQNNDEAVAVDKEDATVQTVDTLETDDESLVSSVFPESPFEGYFKEYQIGDYVHALFILKDSSLVSLWLPNDNIIDINYIKDKLNNSKGRLIMIFYDVQSKFIPEAGDTIKLEIIKSIEIIK